VTDSAGGNVVKLTNNNITSEDPWWSRDGTKIYFVRNTDKQLKKASIFEMDPGGKDLRRLTSVSALDRSPRVSPDGSRLAFQSDRDGNNEIYILRLR
jgi:Tol biopolymer transport system component